MVTKRAVERHVNSIFLKLGLPDDGETSRRAKAALLSSGRRRSARRLASLSPITRSG